ncbi:MAG: hypothetical protein KGH61_05185 [Candidatus Micrarchaeota archaeon]|nr:hypothetical protein [Candidatus Micrarchaeota archaeon]MDE1848308.1 hypothetical protein [Candidatus Micrarchaeota archaeon]
MVGNRIQILGSVNSGRSIEIMLESGGLESEVTSEELSQMICKRGSVALVQQLGEYAEHFPESRDRIVAAFDLCAEAGECIGIAKAAKGCVSTILALNMLEILCTE